MAFGGWAMHKQHTCTWAPRARATYLHMGPTCTSDTSAHGPGMHKRHTCIWAWHAQVTHLHMGPACTSDKRHTCTWARRAQATHLHMAPRARATHLHMAPRARATHLHMAPRARATHQSCCEACASHTPAGGPHDSSLTQKICLPGLPIKCRGCTASSTSATRDRRMRTGHRSNRRRGTPCRPGPWGWGCSSRRGRSTGRR